MFEKLKDFKFPTLSMADKINGATLALTVVAAGMFIKLCSILYEMSTLIYLLKCLGSVIVFVALWYGCAVFLHYKRTKPKKS